MADARKINVADILGNTIGLALDATVGAVKTAVEAVRDRLPAAFGAGGGVKVDGSGTPLPVSGTFWQATQPVSGTVTANEGTSVAAADAGPKRIVSAAGQELFGPGDTPGDVNLATMGGVALAASNPLPIRVSNGTAYIEPRLAMDYLIASSGALDGTSAKWVTIHGRRSLGWTSTSLGGDVCNYLDTSQARRNTPSAGTTLYVVSTNANDTAAGTGVQTIRIVYINNVGVEGTATATLNGLTPVSLGTGFAFVQWMEAASVGADGAAVGAISITSTNGSATVASTFDQIAAGDTRSRSGGYYVPAGKTAYLAGWSGGAVGAAMDANLLADVYANDRALVAGVFHPQCSAAIGSGVLLPAAPISMLKCPTTAVIKAAAVPGTTTSNRCDVSFTLLVVG